MPLRRFCGDGRGLRSGGGVQVRRVSPGQHDVFDRVLGARQGTVATQADGRLMGAIDGKVVRGAKKRTGRHSYLVAA
jgi:hypothetical protein